MKFNYILLVTIFLQVTLGKKVVAQICTANDVVQLGNVDCSETWILELEDNFDNGTLDVNKWGYVYPWMPSDGLAFYTYNNLNFVSQSGNASGVLQLISKVEPVAGYDFTSGMIISKGLFGYGKYEIRCKIPTGKGHWPAFWIFGVDPNTWQEVDFFEFWSKKNCGAEQNDKVNTTVHYNPINQTEIGKEMCLDTWSNGTDYSLSFHTFTVIYLPTETRWYVDGVLIRVVTRFNTILGQQVTCSALQEFQTYSITASYPKGTPSNIIINSNLECSNANLPNAFEIDYVRYWKRQEQETINYCGYITNIISPFFGYKIGDNVNLFLNASVNQFAEVVARNEIHISSNFHAVAGSYFHAKIDPNVCGNNAKLADSIPQNGEFSHNIKDTTEVINSSLQSAKQVEIGNTNGNQFIQVFPNPNNGQFNVLLPTISETVKLELTDLLGNVMMTEHTTKNNYIFDLSGYPKGMYLLKITIDSTVNVQKIIYQ